ncbi:PAS domain S-box protein [Sphingomonas sp. A2-49]|uniref:PAS domain S-box protein n=1 Tax=Sphingomonas sp. A2-49 TaxID=1391375 RepID=UPI0021CEE848|nr:PAS domain S-box protein [Sphingomonas sp. A2-49]MCU6456112.1 PAS domain S-box protein [Sphingomonas sp. A2-49]
MSDPASAARAQPTLRHLDQLMAQLLDGVILLDPTGVILSANAAALAMHGVKQVAALGATAEDYAARFAMWSADHRPLKLRDYPVFRLLAGAPLADMVVEVAPAGEDDARWVHQVRDVVMDVDGGEPDYLALVLSDVSQRFDAEARFAAMFRSNPAPAIIVRLHDLRILRANPGFLSLTGFAADQLEGRSLFGLDLLGDLPDAGAVRRRMEAGAVVPQTEAGLRVADGSRRLVLFAGQPIDVTQEDALLLTFADLEPRRQAERERAASERHLQAVFDMAPVAMAITQGDDHRIVHVNAAFRQLTGHDDDRALQRTADELALWDDAAQRIAIEADLGTAQGVRGREVRLIARSGAVVETLVSAETVSIQQAACVLWVFHDVTERRRSEAELGAAIDEVLKDASWLSRSILDKLATLRRPAPHPVAVDLSPREREILDLICDDLDDGAIADRLAIARNTVRNHVARLYAKIGVNRRSGAVVWGRERGMGSRRD